MQKILLLVVLFFFSSSVFAVELWQGLESEVSTRQVLKKFPKARKDKVSPDVNIDHEGYSRLVLDNYKIFNENFGVIFSFYYDKLKHVQLQTELNEFNVVWSEALTALTFKYGAPTSNTGYDEDFGLSMAVWHRDGIEIVLLDSSDELFITYSTEVIDNANKL